METGIYILIRLSEAELEAVRAKASKSGKQIEEYVKSLITGSAPTSTQVAVATPPIIQQQQTQADDSQRRKSGRTAIDVLREQGATFQVDVAPRLNNVDAYFAKLKAGGGRGIRDERR